MQQVVRATADKYTAVPFSTLYKIPKYSCIKNNNDPKTKA